MAGKLQMLYMYNFSNENKMDWLVIKHTMLKFSQYEIDLNISRTSKEVQLIVEINSKIGLTLLESFTKHLKKNQYQFYTFSLRK